MKHAKAGTTEIVDLITKIAMLLKKFRLVTEVQWNPVNTDTKETGHSVRIIRVSVLSGLSEKMSGTHVLSI